MKEIRIHGSRGQGSLVLGQFLAIAASNDGRYSQGLNKDHLPGIHPRDWTAFFRDMDDRE